MKNFNRTKMTNGKPVRITDVRSNDGAVRISLTTKEPGRLLRGITRTDSSMLFIDKEWLPVWDMLNFVNFLNDHDEIVVEYSGEDISNLYECELDHETRQVVPAFHQTAEDTWEFEGILIPLN